ncbi:probable BOI-related E3 ubiquitin-protein ligase 2 [Aristolochia californica]|uniref:probable BOI-related E3 ubiquitin-protein ligase 2 n=1 Tax=Aristolochia californica TaxID=171875 RepID=UPI0035E1B39B
MFGGDNNNTVFPIFLEGNQFQYDSTGSTQLQLFGNFTAGCNVDRMNFNNNDHVSATSGPNNGREAEGNSRNQKLQISLHNFCQDEADQSAGIPPTAVSTGLRLSYDDDERNSSVTSASDSMNTLPVILSLGDNLRTEIDRHKEEFDHYLRVQEEHIMKGVREMRQRHMATFLSAIEKGVGRKVQKKELEIENMNRKNRELIEKIKQVAAEAQSWHYRARYNESVVNVLKNNLKQAIAQGADQGREGCGDSEVDDAASAYDYKVAPGDVSARRSTGALREQMTCRACKSKEVCVLLLPCRHLCLCKDCEGFIEVCPICECMKTASVQVYMC